MVKEIFDLVPFSIVLGLGTIYCIIAGLAIHHMNVKNKPGPLLVILACGAVAMLVMFVS